MSRDRRKTPRVSVDVPVRVSVDGRTLPGQLRDVCRDAALVEVHHRCTLGSPARLSWDTGSGTVEVAGTVIRLAEGEGDAQGVAVLFSSVPPAAATSIELMLDRH